MYRYYVSFHVITENVFFKLYKYKISYKINDSVYIYILNSILLILLSYMYIGLILNTHTESFYIQ